MTRVDDLRQQAIQAWKGLLGAKEPKRTVIPALLGDVQGTYEVPGREAFSYVRPYHLDQERLAAYNGGRIRNGAAIPVLVEIVTQPGQEPVATIISRDYHGSPEWDEGTFPYYVAKHAETHEASPNEGDDVVNIYKRAITELRADQQATPNLTVQVQAGLWYYGTAQRYFAGGNSPAMAAPAAGYRWDLLYLTNANVLAITTGTAAGTPDLAARPDPTADTLPIAYIYLSSTTTAITNDLIYDARQLADQVLSSSLASHAHSGGPHTGVVIGTEVDDYSVNAAQMQATVDPYPTGVESLATTYQGELARLRYLLAQITGEANWYIDPYMTIAAIGPLISTLEDATFVTTEGEAGLPSEKVLGPEIIMRGLAADKPATGIEGRIYAESDGPDYIVWRDSGSEPLAGYAYKKKLKFDTATIGVASSQENFPVCVHINASSWPTAGERAAFFGAHNVAGKRVQFFDTNVAVNLDYEVELYDSGTPEAIYWVRVPQVDGNSDADYIWVAFGNDPSGADQDNPSEVWDSSFKLVSHLQDEKAPSVSVSDQGVMFTAFDIIGGSASDRMEDCAVIKGHDGKFYLFFDDFTGATNHDVHCMRSDTGGPLFTTYTDMGKVITRANSRVAAIIWDETNEEYILYVYDTSDKNTHAYYISEAGFPGADAGNDWTDAGIVLGQSVGKWDDTLAKIGSVYKDGSTYIAYYKGTDGTNHGLGKATSADPRGVFAKDGSNPLLMNSWQDIGMDWHDYGANFAIRGMLPISEDIGDRYLFFTEGLDVGNFWRVGALYVNDDYSFAFESAGSPYLGAGSTPSYANPNTILVDSGTIYLYFQSSKAGGASWEFYNQHVATVTIGADTDTRTIRNPTTADRIEKLNEDEPTEVSTQVGKGQDFDGINDYCTIGADGFNTSVFAYEAWVKPVSVAKYQVLKGNSAIADGPMWRLQDDGKLRLIKQNVGAIGTSTSAILDSVWTHIAVTYDASGNFAFYKNGALDGSGTNLQAFVFSDVLLGRYSIGNAIQFYDGDMDEFRMSNAVRSAAWMKLTYYSMLKTNFNGDSWLSWDAAEAIASGWVEIARAGVDYHLFYGRNLVKNSPGQIVTDGAEPQWWDDVANATMTDEDLAGAAIAEKHKRAYKVVTIADNVYGYQTFTFADEALLDAGQTVVSVSCWVYCASASKASIGIYGANLGLQESSQVGAGAWQLLTVENKILNAADTSIQLRLIVDTGTAYFTMPMLNVGPKALPWIPRGTKKVSRQLVHQVALATTGDVAWTDTDCTANTDPLATAVHLRVLVNEPNGTVGSSVMVSHSNTIVGADTNIVYCVQQVLGTATIMNAGPVICDDGQNIRYSVNEVDADSDVAAYISIVAYEMWE